MNRRDYRWLGALYVLLGLPGLTALVLGKLHRGGNPYFALSFMGVPLGLLFLAAARERFPRSFLSDTAAKLGFVALLQLAFMMGARQILLAGRLGFGTAYHFFGMLSSFLSLLALVLLLAALAKRGERTTGAGE